MFKHFHKRYFIALMASGLMFVGVSFKEDFFEVAKQIEIFNNTRENIPE